MPQQLTKIQIQERANRKRRRREMFGQTVPKGTHPSRRVDVQPVAKAIFIPMSTPESKMAELLAFINRRFGWNRKGR